MFKTLTLTAALTLGLAAGAAQAAEVEVHIEDFDFSFEGMFGSYDQMQLQRGLQVFTEICSGCHGMQYVPFRALREEGGIGWNNDEIRAYVADAGLDETWDPTLDDGFGDYRDTDVNIDHFPANDGVGAPDLSLMAKARAGFHGPHGLGINQLIYGMGGPEYIASLLTGYADTPECAIDDPSVDGLYYNTAFAAGGYAENCIDENGKHKVPGSWISMGPPLWGEDVDFADGSPNDIHSEAADVAAFLMWAAEPGLNARKQAGLTGVIFLSVLAVLLYLTNKRIWARAKGKDQDLA